MSEAIVVTAEFRLKRDRVNDWLRLMLGGSKHLGSHWIPTVSPSP